MALHKDLPPLLALRAFEAVARHLSFIKAASELSVTQSALAGIARISVSPLNTDEEAERLMAALRALRD